LTFKNSKFSYAAMKKRLIFHTFGTLYSQKCLSAKIEENLDSYPSENPKD